MRGRGLDPWHVLVATCWLGEPPAGASDLQLRRALALAARNDVEAPFVQAYAERLPDDVRRINRAVAGYRRNLSEACTRLREAGVVPILIKASPDEDFTYSNFDVVVGDDGWDRAERALMGWARRTSRHPLERATKRLFYPAEGPAVHLHRSVAWFDVPAIPTEALRRRAQPAPGIACLVPGRVDAFRILLAHAVFQNLALSLGDLRTYRDLVDEGTVGEAAALARAEGWDRGLAGAIRVADAAIRSLDRLEHVKLPVPLSVAGSILGGFEHAVHVARQGDPATAVREMLLRGPLVLAKRRHTAFS